MSVSESISTSCNTQACPICGPMIVSNSGEFDGSYALLDGLTYNRRAYYCESTRKYLYYAFGYYDQWFISPSLGALSYASTSRFTFSNASLGEEITGTWMQFAGSQLRSVSLVLTCGCNGVTTWKSAKSDRCKPVSKCDFEPTPPGISYY